MQSTQNQMTTKKLFSIIEQVNKLIKKQDEERKLLRKLVITLAHKYLKESQIQKCVIDWEETVAALDYKLFNKQYPFRFIQPKYLRGSDLKPVQVQCGGDKELYLPLKDSDETESKS